MKTKYPYKFAAKTSIAWTTLTLILAGCGQIHSSKGSGNSAGTSPVSTDNVSQKQTSSLALQLPGSVPAQVDQVKVTLTELQLAVGAPCSVDMNTGKESCPSLPPPWTKTYTFSTKDQTPKIDDLKPLSYHIAIDLLNAKSGKVYEHGDASVIIESNKTATAHIALSNVSSDNGSLTITIGDAKNAPGSSNSVNGCILRAPEVTPLYYRPDNRILVVDTTSDKICPATAVAPVCVARGKSQVFEVYEFKRATNSCAYLPLPAVYTRVSDSLCKGLPGAIKS